MRCCFASVFLMLLFSVSRTVAQEPTTSRMISVSGTAVAKITPDLIVWHLSLLDTDKDLRTAKQRNDEKIKRIFALRDDLSVSDGDLQTGRVSVRRINKLDPHGNRTDEFQHFEIRRSVSIWQRELKRFDEFLEELVSSADMDASFSWESTKIHEVRADTRLKALRAAKDKAQAMAEVVDAKVGSVIRIDEHPPSGDWRSSMLTNTAFIHRGGVPTADVASGTSAPGAIEVKVTVYATFELE